MKEKKRLSGMTKKERDCLVAIRESTVAPFPARLCEVARIMGISSPSALEIIGRLKGKNLAESRNGMITLTEEGDAEYERIVLNHRVLESLFVQSGISMEKACRDIKAFDYFLDTRTSLAILRKIGNPASCPHGDPIRVGTEGGQ
ncbi:MAG: metal-dependent transcriptional regulator [Thermoplasmata archaeon]|nr:metal-dependent transcriptional regulator [Candidatus Sysuiplasma acidicola]MDH2905611.1 metal-dependent transcriptional regulator [Methanomassiliicoccales archaeon]